MLRQDDAARTRTDEAGRGNILYPNPTLTHARLEHGRALQGRMTRNVGMYFAATFAQLVFLVHPQKAVPSSDILCRPGTMVPYALPAVNVSLPNLYASYYGWCSFPVIRFPFTFPSTDTENEA